MALQVDVDELKRRVSELLTRVEAGEEVVVWPTDTGATHKDSGKLVSINGDEVVIEVSGEKGSVRVHAPRHGFRVEKLDSFEERRAPTKL